jgi:hypothetical protein
LSLCSVEHRENGRLVKSVVFSLTLTLSRWERGIGRRISENQTLICEDRIRNAKRAEWASLSQRERVRVRESG